MSGPTVALTGITHRYGRFDRDPRASLGDPALVADDLVMQSGSTAVLGPNGSGKSTLLRLIATVSGAQTGAVRIGGLDPAIPGERTVVRRRLGYQTQSGALPPRMRVDAFCDYVGALKEIRSQRHRRRWTHWVLQRVGLDAVARDRIRSLSGGTQRRVALAQALIGLPDLLVLDEPLSSLDADHRTNVVGIVTERAAASTVVVATHHVDELAGACGRVVVLDRGHVRFHGTPADLARRARGLVWESDRVDGTANCRSVGAGRYRCVGMSIPPGRSPVEPSVQDGYIALVASPG